MMKKLFHAVIAFLVVACLWQGPPPVQSGISCPVPNTLTNGTTADATQVMANFNAITACLQANIAASGANSDITGLFGLTTPIAPSGGGTPIFIGSGAAGAPNAQTIATTTPTPFALANGRGVLFIANVTNTAATTLAVGTTGGQAVIKTSSAGTQALTGGEIRASSLYLVVWNGSQWQLMNPSPPTGPTLQAFSIPGGVTYVTPAGATWLEVHMVGSGAGGGADTGNAGGNGGTVTFSTGTANGGTGNTGGSFSGCTSGGVGQSGGAPTQSVGGGVSNGTGGTGGASYYGGGGSGAQAGPGVAGATGTGGGGGGAGGAAGSTQPSGYGGGAGGYCYLIIRTPATGYTGNISGAGAGGVGNLNGGAGGTGVIYVIEHYGS